MSSTYRQRFFQEDRESSLKLQFKGRVFMLQVCLNYAGSESPLNCTIDGDRVRELAKKSGVTNIEYIYDDGSTPLVPTKDVVVEALIRTCQKCGPGDYFVFQYSGHGDQVKDQEGDEASGFDSTLCLLDENGEIVNLVDDQIAELISANLNPKAYCLLLVDACHSGTVLDTSRKDCWKGGRKAFCISGCQDGQLSTDTGDGGVMTLALLEILKDKQVLKRRKKRQASLQYVFNRMVSRMPDQEGGEGKGVEGEQDQGEEYDEEEGYYEVDEGLDDYYDYDMDEYEYEGEDMVQEPEPGQNLNLSWCGGVDPVDVPFPF